MAVILAWSLARLVMDDPTELQRQPLPLNGSPVDTHQPANVIAEPVAVKLSAVKADVQVVVRDGNGEIVFSGDLPLGQHEAARGAAAGQDQDLRRRRNGGEGRRRGPGHAGQTGRAGASHLLRGIAAS